MTTEATSGDEQEQLLELLYRTAAGIITCDPQGQVHLINAAASRILQEANPGGDALDVLGLLIRHDPALRSLLDAPPPLGGTICQDRRVRISRANGLTLFFIDVTIGKIDDKTLLITLRDATQIEKAEQIAREALIEQAVHQSRLEAAASVLHDIGNAMTGIGTHLAEMVGEQQWPELKQISMLAQLVRDQQSAFATVLGPRRASALPQFLQALEETLLRRREENLQRAQGMVVAVAHVQEILDIQRRYVRGGTSTPRVNVQLFDLVSAVVSLTETQARKLRAGMRIIVPRTLPPVVVDQTQITQVLINLVKNGLEAMAFNAEQDQRQVEIEAMLQGSNVVIAVRDTATGLSPQDMSKLFQHGYTTKPNGSGIGLASSRLIAESHGGSLELRPREPGPGAEAELRLPLSPKS